MCVELYCRSCYITEMFEFQSVGGPMTMRLEVGLWCLYCSVTLRVNVLKWIRSQNNSEMLIIILT